jgi:hypothetical protein
MKMDRCLVCDGIPGGKKNEEIIFFSENKEGIGMLMDMYSNILGGKTYLKEWKMTIM